MTSETRPTVFTSLVESKSQHLALLNVERVLFFCSATNWAWLVVSLTEAHDLADSSYCLHITGRLVSRLYHTYRVFKVVYRKSIRPQNGQLIPLQLLI